MTYGLVPMTLEGASMSRLFNPQGPVKAEFKFYDPKHGEVTYTCQLEDLTLEVDTETENLDHLLPEELLDIPFTCFRDNAIVVLREVKVKKNLAGQFGKIKARRHSE